MYMIIFVGLGITITMLIYYPVTFLVYLSILYFFLLHVLKLVSSPSLNRNESCEPVYYGTSLEDRLCTNKAAFTSP